MSDKTIVVEVWRGCVTNVTGLPEGWSYKVKDMDTLEEDIVFRYGVGGC